MVVPMLPGRAVRTIRRLQAANWVASRAIASPTVDLVLTRPGVGTLDAQDVVIDWRPGATNRHVTSPGDDTPAADVTFRRLIANGFDVQPGDTFDLDGQKGSIAKVKRYKGMIRAEGRWVTGSVWP